ncbi:hypothetical protein AVEN_250716-1 [Araneus ventricosus]|uniref:Uncharacterized protein n=1 Tax=Araneus ventricosus TaxID=182803 RepID=A0A4Y2N7K9_ARAVE|nr:hypothetical protein AVEN_250716-1 [Araneus ventricosus]
MVAFHVIYYLPGYPRYFATRHSPMFLRWSLYPGMGQLLLLYIALLLVPRQQHHFHGVLRDLVSNKKIVNASVKKLPVFYEYFYQQWVVVSRNIRECINTTSGIGVYNTSAIF